MEEYHDHSLRGRVFQKIREDILTGVYKEHDELREVSIGEELGVSRTPVREALRQLELEGLVTIVPNKGAYVTGITPQDVHDIYKIRSLLEGLCARWATEHITGRQIEELEEIILCQNSTCAKRVPSRPNRCRNWMESSIKSCTKPLIVVYWNTYYPISINMSRWQG